MKMRSLAPIAAAAAFILLPTSSQAGFRNDDCFGWMRGDWFGWMRDVRAPDTKRVDDRLFGWMRHDRRYR